MGGVRSPHAERGRGDGFDGLWIGAFAELDIPVAWSRLRPEAAQLLAFVTPSELG